jgi:hypothetical protein
MNTVEIIEKIIGYLESTGVKIDKTSLANSVGSKYKAFWARFSRKSISDEDLIGIAETLNLDLNKFKHTSRAIDIDPREFIIQEPKLHEIEFMNTAIDSNLIVVGTAGSGKTLLIKKLATLNAKAGEKIVIINSHGCDESEFNDLLSQYNSSKIKIDPTLENINSQIVIIKAITYISYPHFSEWGTNKEDSEAIIIDSILREADNFGVHRVYILEASKAITKYFFTPNYYKTRSQIVAEVQPIDELFYPSENAEQLNQIFPHAVLLRIAPFIYEHIRKHYKIGDEFDYLMQPYRYSTIGLLNTPFGHKELIELKYSEEEIHSISHLLKKTE